MTMHDPSTLYRKLIEHMNEAVWMGDKDERTIYANPKFCEIMGYTLEEMLGRESYDFWDDESEKRVREVNNTNRKKGISSSYEGTLYTKDGKYIPVLLSGTPLPEGGTIGIMTDLTELKKKEEKERVLTNAMQYATDAIIIADEDGTIESWNKGAKIIFGYTESEIIGKPLKKIFAESDLKEMLSQSKVVYNFELVGKHKNKQKVIVSTTLSPIAHGRNGEKRYYSLLIARDITGQRKFEEELTLKYQKMREAYNNFGVNRRQMDYMFEMLDVCSRNQDFSTVANFIANSVIMLSRADACVLRILDSKKGKLNMVSSFGVSADWSGKVALQYKGSLAEKAYEQQAPIKIIDVTKEPKYTSPHLARKLGFSSLLVVPLSFQSKFLGSLTLYVKPEKKLELFENDFIEQYAKLVSLVITKQGDVS